jgi:lysophospholipase L1-like esterase
MQETRATAPRRPGTWGRLAALALLSVVSLAVVAELLARAFVPPLPPIYCVHPYANYVWSPDLAIEYRSRRGEGPLMTLETDRFGFRSSSLKTVEKPAGTKRIFFFGGSVLAGVDAPEPETVPGLVESALRARFHDDPHVECVNASLSGANLEKEFSDFAHLVLPFQPDVVVLYSGINDELDSVDPRFDPTRYSERIAEPDRLGRWLVRHLRLAQWVAWRKLARGHNPFLERPPLELDRPIESWPKLDLEPGFKSWRRYLGMFEAVAKATGTKLVLVTPGTLWREEAMPERERAALGYCYRYGDRISIPDFARLHRRYMDAERSLAKEGGHGLVDGEALLPKTLDYFIDDMHLTPAGRKLLAEAIADRLAAE